MNRQEIEEKLKGIIANKLGVDEVEILQNSDLDNDLGADSFDKVEIIMDTESAFAISIPDEEADRVVTFKHLVDLVEKKIK